MKIPSKKKLLFFILTLLSALLSVVGLILVLINDFGDYQILYIFLVLIVGLLLMNSFKYRLGQEIYLEQHYLLLKNKIEPYSIGKPLLTKEWIFDITQKGFKRYKDFTNISYYYRINKLSGKNKSGKTLSLLILIHDPKINYDSPLIVNQINSLEDELRKKEKYRQRVFIHVKSFNQIDEIAMSQTEKVFWIRKGNENIVSINLSYFEKEKQVYYIENKSYTPNRYYNHAIDEIKSMIK
ncbi:hypothetical protein [Acholeplasma granularum]|uniref:hypothetical protein n=1 Tax=Acholeplasma granularum TaxID=264635 RepID=UPI00046F6112|nr:hypothetical protein [Acholeplasma granularum]